MTLPGSPAAPHQIVLSLPDQHVLGKLATSFAERLPLGLREIRALLASDGCPLQCHQLADVVRYYRARGAMVPFRIVRFGGMEVAVASQQARAAAQVGAAAVRMVQHWGIVSVQALVDRTEIVSTALVPRAFVERLLAALPATRWLDGAGQRRDWFSFSARRTGLGEAVDKLLSLQRRVSVEDLRAALARVSTAVSEAPATVLERYLLDLAGCSVSDGCVSATASGDRPLLTKAEATLVELLRGAGGRLEPGTLRRRAAEKELSDATLTRLLRFSPLVTRTIDGDVRLLGDEGPAPGRRERATDISPAKEKPAPTRSLLRVRLAS